MLIELISRAGWQGGQAQLTGREVSLAMKRLSSILVGKFIEDNSG